MTATHGKQTTKCNLHPSHLQTYGYLKCSSVKCYKHIGDACSFVFKKIECLFENSIRLFQSGVTFNKCSHSKR